MKLNNVARLASVLALSSMAILGCSKDHDLDDYKQEQFQQYYAKVAAVAGRYSGSLKSSRDGQVISALQITLRADAQQVSSGDNSSDTVKPVLTAEIIFAGESDRVEVPLTQATYIDTNHLFHGELAIPQDQGSSLPAITLNLTGTISDGGQFDGTISENGYEDQGGTFQLDRDGQTVGAIAQSLGLGEGSIFGSANEQVSYQYIGKSQRAGAKTAEDVTMTVSTPPRTRLQEIADLLVPGQERTVSVGLQLNEQSTIGFAGATLDNNEERLKGTTTISSSSSSSTGHVNLTCDKFIFASAPYNFTCVYQSDLNGQGAAKMTFQSK